MVKKLMAPIVILLSFILIITSTNAIASNEYNRNYVEDNANLFSIEEKEIISQELETISNSYNTPVYILTRNENYSGSVRNFADNQLETRLGNNSDGILLFIDLYNSEVYITITGDTVLRTISDDRQDYILDTVAPLIRNNPLQMGQEFASIVNRYLEQGPIRGIEIVEEKSIDLKDVAIASVAGVLTSIFSYFNYKSGVTINPEPLVYSLLGKSTSKLMGPDAKLIDSQKFYRNIPRPTNYGGLNTGGSSSRTTVHRSSSGRTFSGRGRKF